MKIRVYIPSFNCAAQVLRLLNDIKKYDEKFFDIITFIENCSSDNTLQELLDFKAKNNSTYKVIAHLQNYGLGGSFKTAVEDANLNNVDYLIWFHGDYQASIKDLKLFFDMSKESNYECIFGSRFMKGSILNNYSILREIGNLFILKIYTLFLKTKIYELGSGLNSYRISSLPKDIENWPNHIAFDANLLFQFANKNTKWVPIEWNNTDQISNAKNFKVAFDLLKMLFSFKLVGKIKTSNTLKITREKIIYD